MDGTMHTLFKMFQWHSRQEEKKRKREEIAHEFRARRNFKKSFPDAEWQRTRVGTRLLRFDDYHETFFQIWWKR